MLNLIKMNLYRFFKTKVFYVTLLITVVAFVFLARLVVDSTAQDYERMQEQQELAAAYQAGHGSLEGFAPDGEYDDEEEDDEDEDYVESESSGHVGIVAGEGVTDESTFEQLYASFTSSGYILILVGIFAIVYTEEERKSGFLKNLLTTRRKKKNIFAAKIPVVFLYTLFMFIGSLLAVKLGSFGHGAEMFELKSAGALLRFMGFEVILHTIFGMAMMAIFEITRNTIIPIIFTIFGAANLHGMLLALLEGKLVSKFPSIADYMHKYALSKHLIVTKISEIGEVWNHFPYVNVIIVIAVGFALYALMGMLVFTKRDTI